MARDHVGHCRFQNVYRAHEIHLHNAPEGLGAEIACAKRGVGGGAGHAEVDLTEHGRNLSVGRSGRRWIGDIYRNGPNGAGKAFARFHNLGKRGRTTGADHDVDPVSGEFEGELSADTGAAAYDPSLVKTPFCHTCLYTALSWVNIGRAKITETENRGTMQRMPGISMGAWRSLMTVLVIAATAALSAPAAGMEPYDGKLAFDVIRGDKSIGSHVITFREVGDETHVDIDIKLVVKIGFLTVFRYEHKNREVWRDGRLVSVETDTDDNGKEFAIRAKKRPDGFFVETLAEETLLPVPVIPTSYWNPVILEDLRWFDTQRGILLDVDVEAGDLEQVLLASGQSVEARRYEITGDLNITVWYTPKGEWVKLVFPARGADIEYVLTDGYTGTRLTQAQ